MLLMVMMKTALMTETTVTTTIQTKMMMVALVIPPTLTLNGCPYQHAARSFVGADVILTKYSKVTFCKDRFQRFASSEAQQGNRHVCEALLA